METEVIIPEVSGEPLGAPAPTVADKASKFKVGNASTHAEAMKDTPPEPAGPAEPAPPANSGEPATTEENPAPGPAANAEPAPANSPKLGSSKNTPAKLATTETPAPAPVQLSDVLKAAGYDDAFIEFSKAYKAGDISRYAQAMATDYSKMSDAQVLTESLKQANPDTTPEEMQYLIESEITDKYKLDSEDQESKEAKAAKIKMGIDARRARTQLNEANEKLKLPTRNTAAEDQTRQTAQQQALQAKQTELLDHPYMKSVSSNKKVGFTNLSITGQDGKVTTIPDFHVDIEDPEEIQRIATDNNTYQSYITDANGKIDGEAVGQISAFVMNRKGFIQAMINYGKMLGKEELIEEKSNPPGPSQRRAPGSDQPKSLKEAFLKGRHGVAG